MADLVTLAQVRAALMLEETETVNDTLLSTVISQVSGKVEDYCNRVFTAAAFTEYMSGDGEKAELFVDNPPIISVSGLWDDVDRVFGSDTEIEATNYIIWEKEGIIELYNDEMYFQKGKANVKVTYSGGYTSVPAGVQGAIIEWVLATFRHLRDKTSGYTSKTAPGGAGSIGVDLAPMPDTVRGALVRHRRPPVV